MFWGNKFGLFGLPGHKNAQNQIEIGFVLIVLGGCSFRGEEDYFGI